MSAREFDPLMLDVPAFASASATLEGRWPLRQLHRLSEACVHDPALLDAGAVAWSARGERRPTRGGEAHVWLHLGAQTRLALECQRCLKPVTVPLQIDRGFLFVHGEDAAAQLDADSEDDVLAISRAFDLLELVEDELLLALPLVPKHDVCPQPLPVPVDEPLVDDPPNPFAALAALKRAGPLN